MSIDVEYAIKKDIRNNPVIREVDARQRREIWRAVRLAGVTVAVVLFAAWQHYKVVDDGMDIELLRRQLTQEAATNRQLHLNLDTLLAPQQIERRARAAGLVPPSSKDTLVIERARTSAPTGAVVARAR